MYVALDKASNDYVAVKRVQMKVDESTVQNESKMLKECGSKYIVRYFDLVKVGNEVWVRLHSFDNYQLISIKLFTPLSSSFSHL